VEILGAVALGILQGLTEFLPVSSSGHLVIAQQFFPLATLGNALAFDVCLHFGTLLAVLAYFRGDLAGMAAAVAGRAPAGEEYLKRWVGLLAVATVPIAIVGLSAREVLLHAFESLPAVGVALLATAGLLVFATRYLAGNRGAEELGLRDALWIGLFQAVAVIPGISRSGATIAGSLGQGLDRATSARFAFLMSLPAIAGAMVSSMGEVGVLLDQHALAVALGTAASALTGWFAIDIMMKAIQVGRLMPFAVYCGVLGAGTLLLGAF